jgi:hypothetical protein
LLLFNPEPTRRLPSPNGKAPHLVETAAAPLTLANQWRFAVARTSLPKQQPATYADAEIRGRLRQWKEGLVRNYRRYDRARKDPETEELIGQFVRRSSRLGRHRAFDRLARRFGPGVSLEGVRLDGNPLAVWSILWPRFSVVLNAPADHSLSQDCVVVNYIMAGVIPEGEDLKGVGAGVHDGLWTLEVPDHALGRVMARSGLAPDAIIRAAHHQLLALRQAVLVNSNGEIEQRQFLVRAGPGGFVCALCAYPDKTLGDAPCVYVRAMTWLAEDMLHDDQVLLVEDGLPGTRLGDGWLLPAPLRRIECDGDRLVLTCQAASAMPGMLARPQGRA